MTTRGARTLSRLFQATMRIIPEKGYSDSVEDANPILGEKGLLFEPDFSSKEDPRIWHYHTRLVFKDGEFLDMDLMDKKRRLLCVGKLFRQSGSPFERRGHIELLVLLFDNYLVITKPVGKNPGTVFHVHKRPMPLDMLKLESDGDTPTRVRRRSTMFLRKDDAAIPHLSELGPPSGTSSHRGKFPFTITYEGRFRGSYTLYADTEETRSMWRSKLEEAIRLRQQSSQVFKVKMLNRESFLMKIGVSNGYLPEGREFTRTINCATPFTTQDGRALTAIGCVEGLWVGDMRDPQSFHRILPLKMVRQCAVLEEFGIILILTHNDLCAYDLESCVPTSTGLKNHHPPQKLNHKGEVSFFRVGVIDGKTRVIFPRKKRTDTIFQTFEVVRSIELEQAPGVTPSDVKPDWFRPHREFLLPFDCTDVIFLRRNLAVLHRNGFCSVNPPELMSVDIPMLGERNFERKNLIKRCASGRPLGMFRFLSDSFLLCYDKFGVYINKDGTLISDRTAVEWEGVAERVSYHHPYILLFSSGFVEVRHADSGQLEQIIRGNGVRCIWEGNGHQGEEPTTVPPSQLSMVGVTNAPAGLDEFAVQCIFTLVPSNRSLPPIQTQALLPTAERPNARL